MGIMFYAISWALSSPPILFLLLLFLADSFFFRARESVVRSVREFFRRRNLRDRLQNNPHDRRARHELASLLLRIGKFAEPLDLLKANVAAGDHDWETLMMMGRACFGTGYAKEGEIFLGEARAQEPRRSMGEVDLELGRGRLNIGDFKGAIAPLEQLCIQRPGTVEGHMLLARAERKSGEGAKARELERKAWSLWWHAPRFVRKRDRAWAFRLHPAPFIAIGLALLAGCFILAGVVPGLFSRSAARGLYAINDRAANSFDIGGALPRAARSYTFIPAPVTVTVTVAVTDAAVTTLRLNQELAGLLDARVLRQVQPPQFQADGAKLKATFGTDREGWDLAAQLRALRHLSSLEPTLDFTLEMNSQSENLKTGSFIDDRLAFGAFLAHTIDRSGKHDAVFQLLLITQVTDEEARALEPRMQTELKEAAVRGEFSYGSPKIHITEEKNGLHLVALIDDDSRTALSLLEILQPVICLTREVCYKTGGAQMGRIPPAEATLVSNESGASIDGTSLLAWFESENRILNEMDGSDHPRAARAQVVTRYPEVVTLLHGHTVTWRTGSSLAGLHLSNSFALQPDGALKSGVQEVETLSGSSLQIVRDRGSWLYANGRRRKLAQGFSEGAFANAAVWLESSVDMPVEPKIKAGESAFHQWLTLQGAEQEIWRSEETHPAKPPRSHLRIGDTVYIDEETSEGDRLLAIHLDSRNVEPLPYFKRSWIVQNLLEGPNQSVVALLVPHVSFLHPDPLAAGAKNMVVVVTQGQLHVVTDQLSPDWKSPIAVVSNELWIDTLGDKPQLGAVSLADGTLRAPITNPLLPAGPEIVSTNASARFRETVAVGTARDGIWVLDKGRAWQAASAELLGSKSQYAWSREGTLALAVEHGERATLYLIREDSRAAIELPLPIEDLSWSDVLDDRTP